MARVNRAVALALALLVTLPAQVSRAADDDNERAEAAFRDGNQAFADGDYHAAFDAYRAAWSLKQSFDIACNLGRTEIELGLSRDAAEHLDYCLRTFSVSSRGEVRDAQKRFHDLFVRVRSEVAGVTVEVHPAGAEITVDGASYGVAPLGHEIFVTPGTHVVRAHLVGRVDDQRSITAEAGGSLQVTLKLANAPAPIAPAAPAAGGSAHPSETATGAGLEPRTIVVISGAALSLVAVGIGVGFALEARSAHDDATRFGETSQVAGGCGAGSTAPDCAALQDAVNRENRNRDRADIALMTGALLGGATLGAWLLIPDFSSNKLASLRAAPWVGAQTSGVLVTGTY